MARVFDLTQAQLRKRTSIKWTRFPADVLPMFVAEMDCELPPTVAERLRRAIADGDTGYPEQPVYQEAYADFARWRWAWDADPSMAVTTGDVMQGMRFALEACTEPGDAVVFNSPIYSPFRETILGTARRGVDVALVDDRLDLDGLERAFADGAKAFLLCSPHNPNGTVHTREELTAVADLAERHGVTVISDEIHAPFNGEEFTPYLSLDVDRAFVATSAAKAFNLAGLKAGLLFASDAERGRLDGLPPYAHEATSHFGAMAHAEALTSAREWLLDASREIAENKRLFSDLLGQHLPQLSYTPSEGTYLAWLDCSPLALEHPGQHFHERGRVRFNFGETFSPAHRQWVRLNLAASQSTIGEGIRRMKLSLSGLDS